MTQRFPNAINHAGITKSAAEDPELAMIKNIVARHGGEIRLTLTAASHGLRISIGLPRRDHDDAGCCRISFRNSY